jgi:hypothetical protein
MKWYGYLGALVFLTGFTSGVWAQILYGPANRWDAWMWLVFVFLIPLAAGVGGYALISNARAEYKRARR